ncbi:MAG: hypothetical protein VX642_04275 [Bdellovibrionota bacterium]|nr:hypothetical protein [Bdellovibrionota bacterium]
MTKFLLIFSFLFSYQVNAQEVDYVTLLTGAFKDQKVSAKCPEWKVLNYYQRPGKNKYGVRIQIKFSEKVTRDISVYRVREILDAKESGVSFSTVAREDLILSKLGEESLKTNYIDEPTIKRLYELMTYAPVYFFDVERQGKSLYVKNIGQISGEEKQGFCK